MSPASSPVASHDAREFLPPRVSKVSIDPVTGFIGMQPDGFGLDLCAFMFGNVGYYMFMWGGGVKL